MIARLVGAACAGVFVQLVYEGAHQYWAAFFLVVALSLFAESGR